VQEYTDEALVKMARLGEASAQNEIFNRYKGHVKNAADLYFIAGADKFDLVQEGMIGLFQAIKEYDEKKSASFKTFALLCVKRRLKDAVKTSRRKKHSFLNEYVSLFSKAYDDQDDTEFIETVSAPELSPEDKVIEEETINDLKETLEHKLAPVELKILKLYLDGHRYSDIAKNCGVNSKYVDNTLQKIKRLLHSDN